TSARRSGSASRACCQSFASTNGDGSATAVKPSAAQRSRMSEKPWTGPSRLGWTKLARMAVRARSMVLPFGEMVLVAADREFSGWALPDAPRLQSGDVEWTTAGVNGAHRGGVDGARASSMTSHNAYYVKTLVWPRAARNLRVKGSGLPFRI